MAKTKLFMAGVRQITAGFGRIVHDSLLPPTTAPTPSKVRELGPTPTPSPPLWEGLRWQVPPNLR